jgi:hypothetical protein
MELHRQATAHHEIVVIIVRSVLSGALRTISRENLRDRQTAYHRSELSLTEFGRSILAHKEDFSRHNPIDRWWGGTRLTNDRLWRWNPVLTKP